MNQLVSIILPTYNGSKTILNAISSVQSQSYNDWELIVVDDGSTDDIESCIPTDARIRYFKNEKNVGIQKSLNRGIVEAKGRYIARIDDDDIWSDTNKLQKQIAFLETNKKYVLVGTGVIIVDEGGNELQRYLLPQTDEAIRSKMLRKNCFIHSSVLFRNLGLTYSEDESVRHAEDYELWLRLGKTGKLANLSTYGVTFTAQATSLTARNRVVQARRVLHLAWKNRVQYPDALIGISTAFVRYIGFMVLRVLPIPQKLFRFIQAKQKSM